MLGPVLLYTPRMFAEAGVALAAGMFFFAGVLSAALRVLPGVHAFLSGVRGGADCRRVLQPTTAAADLQWT